MTNCCLGVKKECLVVFLIACCAASWLAQQLRSFALKMRQLLRCASNLGSFLIAAPAKQAQHRKQSLLRAAQPATNLLYPLRYT
jgi:hypothetical protein